MIPFQQSFLSGKTFSMLAGYASDNLAKESGMYTDYFLCQKSSPTFTL